MLLHVNKNCTDGVDLILWTWEVYISARAYLPLTTGSILYIYIHNTNKHLGHKVTKWKRLVLQVYLGSKPKFSAI